MTLQTKDIIKEYDLHNIETSRKLAQKLSLLLKTGDIITFVGELGTGKTEFCRAIIHGLGYLEDVPSPTFSLVQTYEPALDDLKTLSVWHIDLYRLDQPEDVIELGIEDAFDDGVTLIEWPQRMGRYLPQEHLQISLSMGEKQDMRKIAFIGDQYWAIRLKDLNL